MGEPYHRMFSDLQGRITVISPSFLGAAPCKGAPASDVLRSFKECPLLREAQQWL